MSADCSGRWQMGGACATHLWGWQAGSLPARLQQVLQQLSGWTLLCSSAEISAAPAVSTCTSYMIQLSQILLTCALSVRLACVTVDRMPLRRVLRPLVLAGTALTGSTPGLSASSGSAKDTLGERAGLAALDSSSLAGALAAACTREALSLELCGACCS